MTDGENTDQWDVRDDRRSGLSPVWVYRECKLVCLVPSGPGVLLSANLLGVA